MIFLIFHRPILTALVRFAIARVAISQNIQIEYQLSGSILSDFSIENLRATPAGKSPVEKIDIEKFRASYSFFGLIRHGSRDFLRSCDIRNATLVLKDENSVSKKTAESHLGKDFHSWFFPPVFFSARVNVENLNLTAHAPDGDDFVLHGANIHLERGKAGWIKIERVKIPGLNVWNPLEGEATLTRDHLVLQRMQVGSELFLDQVISAPSFDKGLSHLSVKARVMGGTLQVDYIDKPRGQYFDTKIHVSAEGLTFEHLNQFLKSPSPLKGEIGKIEVQAQGNPDVPSSWQGTVTIDGTSPILLGSLKIDHAAASLQIDKGAAQFESSLRSGTANKGTITAKFTLPDRLSKMRDMVLDGRSQIAAAALNESFSETTHGNLIAEGQFHLRRGEFNTDFMLTGSEINSGKCDVTSINIKASLAKKFPEQKGPRPEFMDDFTGHVTVQFQGLRMDKYAFDSGTVTIDDKEGWLRLDATELKRDKNTASLGAAIHVPSDLTKLPSADFDCNFAISAPDIAAFNAETNLTGLNGQLEARGEMKKRSGVYEGKIESQGTKLVISDFNAESLNLNAVIEKNVAVISNSSLVIDAKNRIALDGKVDLGKTLQYEGAIKGDIADLSTFNPFLKNVGVKEKIAGSLAIDWSGNGSISDYRHGGNGSIKLSGGKYGKFQPIVAEIEGNYSPEAADIPVLHVRVDKTDFKAQIALKDTELNIHNILLVQEKINLLRGELMLPLDLRTPNKPETLIPSTGRIFSNLSSDEVNLDTLLVQPKQTSPLKGNLKVSLNADGPLDNLVANILVRGRNLQSKAAPTVAPANLELNIDLKENQLTMQGSLQQPAISPLLLNGKLPFPLKQIIKDGKLDETSPIDLSMKMEKSPVAILGQLIQGIRYIDGQMEVNAKAAGTIAKPELSGALKLDLPGVRMRDPNAPAVNGFKADVVFSGNEITVNKMSGDISGGSFNLGGKIKLEKLTEPLLDLRFTSQNALLVRNETLTVRVDSDIKIAGIFNAAAVTGNIGITKSKFFREVEILPIELPGRPAPKPASESQMGFSLKPPLSKWTFDVAIKTKDPFLVRGNLANGAVHIDLKLGGTGATPTLDGMVRIDNFVASLPFSRLNIDYGYVYFSAENPFVPSLDIQGTSSLRDYNIHVYISGTPSDPISIFTSEPPLPQEEIIALLGTGATTEELTSNSEVLAGRAAVLVFQKLYRKIFKQKPQENESFLTRFELDPGAVDPRTGKQEVSARFKVNDQYYLVGDIDAQGGLRGQVRYLLRFR